MYLHVADFGVIAVVAVFAITVVLLALFGFGKSSRGPSIPGPERSDPESGNLDDVRKAGSLHEYNVYLHNTYGRVVGFWWGKTYTVSVACPYLWKDLQGVFDFFLTPIMTPFGVVLHDPEFFPEPQRFDPDRFSPENVKDRPSLAYQPFGFAGKRKCPGWRFSINEGLVFLSVFVRRFKVELVEGQKVEPVYRLVTSPKEEVWITISKR